MPKTSVSKNFSKKDNICLCGANINFRAPLAIFFNGISLVLMTWQPHGARRETDVQLSLRAERARGPPQRKPNGQREREGSIDSKETAGGSTNEAKKRNRGTHRAREKEARSERAAKEDAQTTRPLAAEHDMRYCKYTTRLPLFLFIYVRANLLGLTLLICRARS